MSFLKKTENFWYYYKWQIIIIAVIVIAFSCLVSEMNPKKEPSDADVLAIYSAYVSDKELDFQNKFESIISDADKNGKAVIAVNELYITPDGKSDNDAFSIAQFEGTMSVAESDLILMDEYNFKRFGTKDCYEDLSKYIDLSKYNDKDIIYRNNIPVAIRLTDSKILKEAEFKTDNIYAGIMFVPENSDDLLLRKRENAVEIILRLAEK